MTRTKFEQLYHRNYPGTVSRARRYVGAADAHDVAQEAWLDAWCKLAAFDESLLAGFVAVAAVRVLRARKRRECHEASVPEPRRFVRAEFAAQVREGFGLLRAQPVRRRVMQLTFWGYRRADVGRRLRIHQQTVRRRLFEARRVMREVV